MLLRRRAIRSLTSIAALAALTACGGANDRAVVDPAAASAPPGQPVSSAPMPPIDAALPGDPAAVSPVPTDSPDIEAQVKAAALDALQLRLDSVDVPLTEQLAEYRDLVAATADPLADELTPVVLVSLSQPLAATEFQQSLEQGGLEITGPVTVSIPAQAFQTVTMRWVAPDGTAADYTAAPASAIASLYETLTAQQNTGGISGVPLEPSEVIEDAVITGFTVEMDAAERAFALNDGRASGLPAILALEVVPTKGGYVPLVAEDVALLEEAPR